MKKACIFVIMVIGTSTGVSWASYEWFTNPANGHQYALTDWGTWDMCEAEAVAVGGHLVTVNDEAERDWLMNTSANPFGSQYARDYPGIQNQNGVWVGLEYVEGDIHSQDSWRWVNGEPITYWEVVPSFYSYHGIHMLMIGAYHYVPAGHFTNGPHHDNIPGEWLRGIIEVVAQQKITVALDIKPQSCPNPLNLKSKGVLPVAILGRQDFDVTTVDIASVRLEGVAPVRGSFEDVTTIAVDANDCPCTTAGPDGYTDLTLKFRTTRVVEELMNNGTQLMHGQEFAATLAGVLLDGTPIEGTDCLVVRGTVPSTLGAKMSDINRDGVVNLLDFSMMAGNWLQAASTGLRLESLWFGIGVKRNAIIMSRTKFETIPPGSDFIIRTNSTTKNSITLFPNTVIPGDVICGPGGDPDTVINTKKNSVVTGDTYAAEEELQFPEVIVPELLYIGSLPPPTSTDPNVIVLTANDSGVYDEIVLGQGKKLHISDGQVVIHVTGNVRIRHGAELRILDNATVPSLDLYLSGDLQADSGSIIDTENHMVTGTRLKIYGTNTCNSIVFMNSSVSAAVYAPHADLEIRNGSAVYGSYTGNNFLMRNSGEFYFDTRILDATID